MGKHGRDVDFPFLVDPGLPAVAYDQMDRVVDAHSDGDTREHDRDHVEGYVQHDHDDEVEHDAGEHRQEGQQAEANRAEPEGGHQEDQHQGCQDRVELIPGQGLGDGQQGQRAAPENGPGIEGAQLPVDQPLNPVDELSVLGLQDDRLGVRVVGPQRDRHPAEILVDRFVLEGLTVPGAGNGPHVAGQEQDRSSALRDREASREAQVHELEILGEGEHVGDVRLLAQGVFDAFDLLQNLRFEKIPAFPLRGFDGHEHAGVPAELADHVVAVPDDLLAFPEIGHVVGLVADVAQGEAEAGDDQDDHGNDVPAPANHPIAQPLHEAGDGALEDPVAIPFPWRGQKGQHRGEEQQ